MDLWVRSQKGLILKKINELMVEHKAGENIYFITDGRSCVLGEYETNERALEVLDEIQMHIKKQDTDELLVNSDGIITGQKHYSRVYEMPEE